MGSKKKGKVLVHFFKDAMKRDWKNSADIRGVIDRSITVLKERKDKKKLSKDAKKQFKELRSTFARKAAEAAKTKAQSQAEPKAAAFSEETARKIEAMILRKITSCPPAFQLYQEACAVQHAEFNRVKNIHPVAQFCVVAKLPSGSEPQADGSCWAECDYYRGRINLVLQDSEKKLVSWALFELCNMKRQVQFREIYEQVRNGQIKTADEYAFASEQVEYGSVLEHHDVLQNILQQSGRQDEWDASMDTYRHMPKTFAEWWPQTKDTYHTNWYRKQYANIVKI